MKHSSLLTAWCLLVLCLSGCQQGPRNSNSTASHAEAYVRPVVDTIGFAHLDWQMDSIISRLSNRVIINPDNSWKTAVVPHDDYKYAGEVEYQTIAGIRAKTIVLFGVAHKAKIFNLENRIVFGSFTHWQAPYGNIRISSIQKDLEAEMPQEMWLVHDSMQRVEHSLEALIPFLQYNNRETEIIPIIVPFMSLDRMNEISGALSKALAKIMREKNLSFGPDLAIVISNDGVHYGDEDWGGRNMAPFGTDSLGNEKARQLDRQIIDSCLLGDLNLRKVSRFVQFTVQEKDYHEYKWTWCGRYAVPLGLLVGNQLNEILSGRPLTGELVRYGSSIDHTHFPVEDLRMGTTAIATPRHWVSFVGMGYR